MATHNAIAAIGQAILGMLASACPRPEFAGAQFELYQGSNFQSPMDEGISLYMHRITPANNIRNLPPRVGPDGRRYRPSLPIDIHYLLIAWARDAAKQHRLLGWAMREMENTPILHAGLLNQYGPEPDTFGANENVDLIHGDYADSRHGRDLGSPPAPVPAQRPVYGADGADRFRSRNHRGRSGADARFRGGKGGSGMTGIQVLETLSLVAPLGLRFWDPWTVTPVSAGLDGDSLARRRSPNSEFRPP